MHVAAAASNCSALNTFGFEYGRLVKDAFFGVLSGFFMIFNYSFIRYRAYRLGSPTTEYMRRMKAGTVSMVSDLAS